MNLPAGTYLVKWLNPVTVKYKKDILAHSKGKAMLTSPIYQQDLALQLIDVNYRIKKQFHSSHR